MTGTTTQGMWKAAAIVGVMLAGVGGMVGCRGERSAQRPRQFLPDMDDSPKWKPQVKSHFFEDSRTLRPKVEGTVAFGDSERLDDETRAEYLKEDSVFYTGLTGYDAKGEPVFVDSIPVSGFEGWPVQAKEGESNTDFLARREAFMGSIIQRGQQRFNIYCSVCHGFAGDGQGMVGQRWSTPVANFHDPKYVDKSVFQGKDGYIFNALRYGVPFPNTKNEAMKMPGYAHSVDEHDAWAIVAYVRVLQTARTNIENVPPTAREELRRVTKPAPKALPEPAPAPAGSTPGTSTTPPTPPSSNPGGTTK